MSAGFAAVVGILMLPGAACAAGAPPLDVAPWSALPFAGLLLAIALLPLFAEHFWHSNRNRAVVSLSFACPVVGYLYYLDATQGQPGLAALTEILHEYGSFMILLGSLYTVSGGLLVKAHIQPTARNNTALLAIGAVLANLIGTTGASMVLIRPFLRMNKPRQRVSHLPIFFIFIVSNLGGLLTPLGDPPLFLGYLRGVDFFWTLRLWPEWLTANGIVLTVFFIWDTLACRREPDRHFLRVAEPGFSVHGFVNLLFLAGIVGAVLARPFATHVQQALGSSLFVAEILVGEIPMIIMALLSLAFTPHGVRTANGYSWAAMIEVAVLFVGIFITMVPPLALLSMHGAKLGLDEPWQYFWLTGSLSAFLDNAPTYLSFATLAAAPHEISWLVEHKPLVLAAVSCGAVFMGAMTYIGNGPNFMVKAICAEAGYPTPSFFGYVVYSTLILVPTFILVMLLEFTPNLNW